MMPETIEGRVLYRDGLMIVLNKPAGMAVHRGPKGGASLEEEFDALRFGLPHPPALAHRLDRETSGCLILGRHRKALAHLGALFRHGRIGKTYWALVAGGPQAESGCIDLPLGRLDPSRGWWMKPEPTGQPAVTHWQVLGRGQDRRTEDGAPDTLTWLSLMPVTGRTHQLRVHCAAMGWPIVGDAIYGSARRHNGPGLQLHAVAVVVPLYPKRAPIRVEAPVPPHLEARLRACGWRADAPTAAVS